mmetsp:Transcript_18434/g.40136  ORF Transcript_18434/g.40136 Transcript_18434/m.40136 type:complete len:213 (+) Transcript_18434:121-759(+)
MTPFYCYTGNRTRHLLALGLAIAVIAVIAEFATSANLVAEANEDYKHSNYRTRSYIRGGALRRELWSDTKDSKRSKKEKKSKSSKGSKSRYGDDDDDDDDSDNSEEDELLGDDQLAMKTIQKKVVKARIKLVELLALLDQARSKRAQDEIDEEEAIFKNDCDTSDEEDDDNGDVQQHDVAFLMMTGKRKLKSAQRDMRKALIEWDDLVSLLS